MTRWRKWLLLLLTVSGILALRWPIAVVRVGTAALALAGGLVLIGWCVVGLSYEGKRWRLSWRRENLPDRTVESRRYWKEGER